ncbi:hypothetical protein [Nocardioides acrostichi]|uniref:Uncharacterized protein n=1 Tax=Nocardioides acrostichi TaxID=2784339 RepID=A0A930UZF3_9ACTN|nr:hypothetical protein [Nocardioides acrostichi]MBF4160399.1 hypothetical protein [Nocardioides acrostichi]
MTGVSDVGDSPLSSQRRDYPAWGYFAMAMVLVAVGLTLGLLHVMDDLTYRPYLPWFMVALGVVAALAGAREWRRNDSLTSRRDKPEQEQRVDEERARLWLRLRWVNVLVVLAAVGGVLVYLAVR